MTHEELSKSINPELLLADLRDKLGSAITIDTLPLEGDILAELQAFLDALDTKAQQNIFAVIAYLKGLDDFGGAGFSEGDNSYHYFVDSAIDLPDGGAVYFLFDHEVPKDVVTDSENPVIDQIIMEQAQAGTQDLTAVEGLIEHIKDKAKQAYVFIVNTQGMQALRAAVAETKNPQTVDILKCHLGYGVNGAQITYADKKALYDMEISSDVSANLVSFEESAMFVSAKSILDTAKWLAAQERAEELLRHGEFRDKYNQAKGDTSLADKQREQLFTDVHAILRNRDPADFIDEAFHLERQLVKEQGWDPAAARMLLAIINGQFVDASLFVDFERSAAFEYLLVGLRAIESSTSGRLES